MKNSLLKRSCYLLALLLFSAFINLNAAPITESNNFNIEDRYVIETDLIDTDGGCWTIRVNIVKISDNGQRQLIHSATIKTGKPCETEGEVLSSSSYTTNDYVTHDTKPQGIPITSFFKENPNMVSEYVQERDELLKQ